LGGAPICTATIPIGGIFVTSDISTVRGVSIETAETIKLSDGCCWEGLLSDDEYFLIPGVGGRPPEQVSRKELCEIMQPRVEEILTMVKEKVYQLTKLKKLSGNVDLTGAGALMPGIIELAQDVFDTASVRIGTSANLGNVIDAYRSADFATATGLLVAFKDRLEVKSQGQGNSIPVAQKNSVLKSIGSFFKEFF
ncbi:MAG TPA: cell division FtsA domain-containing protein, partial [Treponemataceae bacterium]|nr:cell division FtsA domain-containing protein [Treponemataceae bacterium]